MLYRLFLLGLLAVLISGCATMGWRPSMVNRDSVAMGYRLGVQENINKFAENFIGNDFPYYYWQAPLVQRVLMPARVRGGVFIPAHYEYVILDPGEWRENFGYPISTEEGVLDEPKYDHKISNFDSSLLGY